jgi:hypothetical protein
LGLQITRFPARPHLLQEAPAVEQAAEKLQQASLGAKPKKEKKEKAPKPEKKEGEQRRRRAALHCSGLAACGGHGPASASRHPLTYLRRHNTHIEVSIQHGQAHAPSGQPANPPSPNTPRPRRTRRQQRRQGG